MANFMQKGTAVVILFHQQHRQWKSTRGHWVMCPLGHGLEEKPQ